MIMTSIILLLLTSHLSHDIYAEQAAVTAAVNDVTAVIPDNEKPWLGAIYWGENLKCSVSLIHPNFVLTADHCNAAPGSPIRYKHLEQTTTVQHTCDICPDQSCDIMLLKLKDPLDAEYINLSPWSHSESTSKGQLYSMGSPDYNRTKIRVETTEPRRDMSCGDGYQGASQLMKTDQGCMCPKDSGGVVTVTENDQEVQVGLLCHLCKRNDQSPNCTSEDVGDPDRNPGEITKCSTIGRIQGFSQEQINKIHTTIDLLMTGDNSKIPEYCQ